MHEIDLLTGKRIRTFRKARGLTLEALAAQICKSKSTLSKYEKGEISLDLPTLYELSQALHIQPVQLLENLPQPDILSLSSPTPTFFGGSTQLYAYLFDGRNNQLLRCVLDILPETYPQRVFFYMNYEHISQYQHCETMYSGSIFHYDALTHISLCNQHTSMEQASIKILASYLDSETKWGLFNGFSSRPMMPIAMKMLISKNRLSEDTSLISCLKVSREDIRLLKLYNMLSVT